MAISQDLISKYNLKVVTPPTPAPSLSTSSQKIVDQYGLRVISPSTSVTAPKSTAFSNWTGIQNPDTYVADAYQQVKDTISHPINQMTKLANAAGESVVNSVKGVASSWQNLLYPDHPSIPQTIANLLSLFGSGVNFVLAPLNTVFAAAEQVPVLKEAADVIGGATVALGNVVDFPVQKFVNSIPDSILSQENKAILAPAFGKFGGLLGQLYLGEKVMDMMAKGIGIGPKEIDTATKEAKTEAETAKQESTKKADMVSTLHDEANQTKMNGPAESVDAIQKVGSRNGEEMKPTTMKVADLTPIKDNFTPEEIKSAVDDINNGNVKPLVVEFRDGKYQVIDGNHSLAGYKELGKTEVPVVVNESGIKATGEVKPFGLSKSVEASAIEKGLIEQWQDIPGSETMNLKEQAGKVADLMAQDYARAERIAMGKELPLPSEDLYPENVYTGVWTKAYKDGNVELMRDLAVKSDIPRTSKIMGQRIKSLDSNLDGDPRRAIQEVDQALKDSVQRKLPTGKKLEKVVNDKVEQFKKVVKEAKIKAVKRSWAELLRDLPC